MLGQQHDVQVFIALGATDMRKSINGLSIIVEEELGLDNIGHIVVYGYTQEDDAVHHQP